MDVPVEALLGGECWVFLWEEIGRCARRNDLVDECVCDEGGSDLMNVQRQSGQAGEL